MKRKMMPLAAVILAAALLASCTLMVKGDVYVGYGWDPYISDFVDYNPAIYYINVVEDQYYRSDTGTYYGGYRSAFGWYYSFEYTLTADYASAGDYYGPYNAYFYLYLDDYGPAIYDPIYSRSLSPGTSQGGQLPKSSETAKGAPAATANRGEPAGVIEKSANGYTITLKYWKLE